MRAFFSCPVVPTLGLALLLSIYCTADKQEPGHATQAPETVQGWRVLGPGGGGAQYLPTINPRDPEHVFVRCDMTGAYVTENGGESWRMFNLRTVVRDFEFDPCDPNTVYAANTGLYRSGDRGKSWRLIYPDPANIVAERMVDDHAGQYFETTDGMPGGPIDKVRVDPSDSGHLYLGLAAPNYFHSAKGRQYTGDSARLMVSHDRGASWRVLAALEGRDVLAIFPGSWWGEPGQVLVFTDRACALINETSGKATRLPLPVEQVAFADGGRGPQGVTLYILAGMEKTAGKISGGIYRSPDCGKTWVQANRGLLGDYPATGRLPRFRTMAACEGTPGVAFLSCSDYPASLNNEVRRQFGIFKTVNAGESWHWSYQADFDSVVSKNHRGSWMMRNYGPEWGEFPHSLGICPTEPDICYATDFGATYRTLDGGKSWEQVYSLDHPDGSNSSRGLDVTTCYGVHFDPFDKEHFFISYTDIAAWHTFNGGKSWLQSREGVPRAWINTCYWVVFDPTQKGRLWSAWGSGHDLPRPKMFRSGNFDRYVGGIALSDNSGRSWQASNTGMPPNTVCTHILLDPDSPAQSRTLFACGFGKGVFKSSDSGKSWELCNKGLGKNLNAWRMALLPDGTLFLLVARGLENRQAVDGLLYRSRDHGETWQVSPLPEGANAPNDLVFDPERPGTMYLSCWPWTEEGKDEGKRVERCGGLYRTSDGGATWKQVFHENAHVYAAAVDPANPSTVFINTFDSAAFRSDDRGESWYRLEGYTFKWGHRPVVDPHHPGMLFLTTFGGSLFYGPSAGVPGAPEDIMDDEFLLWQPVGN